MATTTAAAGTQVPPRPNPSPSPTAVMGMAMTIASAGTQAPHRSPVLANPFSQRKLVLRSPILLAAISPVRNTPPCHGLGLRTRRPPQRTCLVLLHGRLLPRFTVARSKRRLRSSAPELPILARPQGEAARVTTVATAAVIARGIPALVKARVTNTCLALTSRRESARTAIPAGTHTPRPFPLRLPPPLFMLDRRNRLQRRLLLPMFLQDLRSMLLFHVFLRKNALLTRSVTGVAITTSGPPTFARLRALRDPHPHRAESYMRVLQSRSVPHQHMPNLFLKESMCRGGRFTLRKPRRPATVAHALRMLHPRFPPR